MVKREERRRASLTPVQRFVEDEYNRLMDEAVLFGEETIDIEEIRAADSKNMFGHPAINDKPHLDEPMFPMPKMDYPSDSFRRPKD